MTAPATTWTACAARQSRWRCSGGGKPVLGVVYAPLAPDDNGDLFAWAEGAALTRNGQLVELKTGGLRVLALNADAADYAARNQAALPVWRIRAILGPAYRLALAAAGEVHAAVSLVPNFYAWDIAGGHALLTGAGGVVTDRHGRSIDYRRTAFDGMIGGRKEAVAALDNRLPTSGHRERCHPARRRSGSVMPHVSPGRRVACWAAQRRRARLGGGVPQCRRNRPLSLRRSSRSHRWRDLGLIAGQPTDDSEMALALARSLVLRNGFDAGAVVQA